MWPPTHSSIDDVLWFDRWFQPKRIMDHASGHEFLAALSGNRRRIQLRLDPWNSPLLNFLRTPARGLGEFRVRPVRADELHFQYDAT